MEPFIQNITFPRDGIVREFLTTSSISFKISHNGGAIISDVSSGSNFDVAVFLTSEEPDIIGSNFTKLPDSTVTIINKPLFLKEMIYETSIDVAFNVNINLDINQCFDLSHICVNLTKGSTGFYFETNSTNNIHCMDIKQNANCKPGML